MKSYSYSEARGNSATVPTKPSGTVPWKFAAAMGPCSAFCPCELAQRHHSM
jgi:hypothetical protein